VQARRDAVELVAVHHWKLLTFFFFFLELFSLFFLHMKIWASPENLKWGLNRYFIGTFFCSLISQIS
jgi:hypothetical protein